MMDKSERLSEIIDIRKYTTAFQQLLLERFYEEVEKRGDFEETELMLWLLNAPEQYLTEDQMLVYAQKHSNATLQQLFDYFEEITPDGPPPGDDEAYEEDADDGGEEYSEYVTRLINRFGYSVYPDGETPVSEEAEDEYIMLIEAPAQCGMEDTMLAYLLEHPQLSVHDLLLHFYHIMPDEFVYVPENGGEE